MRSATAILLELHCVSVSSSRPPRRRRSEPRALVHQSSVGEDGGSGDVAGAVRNAMGSFIASAPRSTTEAMLWVLGFRYCSALAAACIVAGKLRLVVKGRYRTLVPCGKVRLSTRTSRDPMVDSGAHCLDELDFLAVSTSPRAELWFL